MSPGGSVEAQNAYASMNAYGQLAADAGRYLDDDASPKGFVTILLFDKNYNFVDAAWDQLNGTYSQSPTTIKDPFDTLRKEITVKEEGYAYIFLSNENPTQVDIHFDDLKITHTKTNVIQYNEYYPFGLQASTSWTREGSDNDYLYNAANELNSTTGWYEMFYRGYDPSIGRMLQVDPYASSYESHTTYNYAVNNPVMMNDPNGGQTKAQGYGGEYVYSNAAADRLYKINNPDAYTEAWAQDFGNYTAAVDAAWEARNSAVITGAAIGFVLEQFKRGADVVFSFGGGQLHSIAAATPSEMLAMIRTEGMRLMEMSNTFASNGKSDWMFQDTRPDADGHLTLTEANDWYKTGGGQPLYVDLGKIDFSNVFRADVERNNGYINLLLKQSVLSQILGGGGNVYGTIKVQLNNDYISVKTPDGYYDTYDFDRKDWGLNPNRWMRNVANYIGDWYAGKGTPYRIYFYGTAILGTPMPPR